MKFILILAILEGIIQLSKGDGYCKGFECSEIKQNNDPQTCVLNIGRHYPVMPCSTGQICDTSDWKLPEYVDSKATCITPKPDPVYGSLPGEYCNKPEDCFQLKDYVSCINNTCTPTKKIGDSCYDLDTDNTLDELCPVGAYCNIQVDDKTKSVCAPTLAVQQTCTKSEKCGFGLMCLATDLPTSFTKFKCIEMHNLVENYQFNIANYVSATPNSRLNGLDHACRSYYSVDFDILNNLKKCNVGDTSNDKDETSLYRASGAGANCTYNSYDPKDAKTTIPKFDLSQCGFNTGSGGYCRKRRGDIWLKNEYQRLSAFNFTAAKCHVSSNGEKCVDLLNMFKAKNYDVNDWYRALQDIDANYGWPLYADNDICVKKTITNYYWKVNPSDFAISSSYNSALILFLIYVILLY